MADDIVPKLIEEITRTFQDLYQNSGTVAELLGKVQAGTATYAEAHDYSLEVSRLIGKAWAEHISSAVLPDGRMYYNISSRLLPSMLDENHALVSDYAVRVQQALNAQAGLGLRALAPTRNADRVNGLVELAANAEQYDEITGTLEAAMETFSQSVVDDTLRANVEFQGGAGLRPKIVRRAESGACKWCRALAGTYTYPDVPKDVYRRHENCRCTVEYDPGSGRRQNVHTKQWTEPVETAKIEARKIIGLKVNGVSVQSVSDHIVQRMAERSVEMESIKDAIERPLDIRPVKYDQYGRPSFVVIGRRATLAINPETGCLTTTYPTHTATAQRLLKKRGEHK